MKSVQTCESLVLTGTQWSSLRYHDILADTVEVIAEGFDGAERRVFRAGADYEVDAERGRIRRTENSAIGDYADSPFYGRGSFNHEDYNGQWGNYPYMVYISYLYERQGNRLMEDEARRITLSLGLPRLGQSVRRLLSGEPVTYLVYGDSISTGCEAIYKKDAYFNLFARKLEQVTGGRVNLVNESVGGETSREGVKRFAQAVEKHRPDLVSIAYGVNDMCLRGDHSDVSPAEYREHMVTMLGQARAAGAEVILITNLTPNPHWVYTNPAFREHAQELRRVAREYGVPLADVQALWESEQAMGKNLSDLLLNDVNHPTTYGHRLYAAMLETLF